MIPRALPVALLVVPVLLAAAGLQDRPPTEGRQPIPPAPPPAARAPAPQAVFPDDHDRTTREIFFAVLEGLYADGVENEIVDAIVAIDEQTRYPANFVYACPVCMPAFDAFRIYRLRPEFYGSKGKRDTFGPGLAEALEQRVLSDDLAVRQQAILELVEDWMRRRMESLRLTDPERERWRREMEARRKQGMAYLESYRRERLGGTYAWMKECPFCEAANGACGNR